MAGLFTIHNLVASTVWMIVFIMHKKSVLFPWQKLFNLCFYKHSSSTVLVAIKFQLCKRTQAYFIVNTNFSNYTSLSLLELTYLASTPPSK